MNKYEQNLTALNRLKRQFDELSIKKRRVDKENKLLKKQLKLLKNKKKNADETEPKKVVEKKKPKQRVWRSFESKPHLNECSEKPGCECVDCNSYGLIGGYRV